MSIFKKSLALLLSLCMLLSFVPFSVSAAITMGTKPADGTTTGNPFIQGTGGSNSFRIPAMVTLNDGTIVAAADARWNTTYDGGGLDTVVSYSTDNGANWNYTFANYLGDNGNTYNGSSSTAFIDPALATDGETVYMLCDLYPYGIALNGSGNTAPSTAVGFNSDGTLKLAKKSSSSYSYYLKDGLIYDSSNSVVSGYTVDDYFNITGTDGTSSNLFFSDSPYQVVRTGYLYLTRSTDGGKTWSAPTLIPNVKDSSEQVCLVGPGRGLVTSDGKIIFPVYTYSGSTDGQQMGFIYSSDKGNTWSRTSTFTGASWSSESAVVELKDGTLRFFYRNGTSKLCYADYTWGTGWGSAVSTGIATNSNTQISAISYSKTVDGKQVILVSCPTGSGSSASDRLNGKIFVGLVNSDKTMDWSTGKPVSLTSQHSSTNYFMYSCLTELSDGSVAILYEDYESAWGIGGYYQMSYSTIAESSFELTFDAASEPEDNVVEDETTGVSVNFGSAEYTMTVAPASPDVLSGRDYVAYDITVENFEGTADVTIPLTDAFKNADASKMKAVYITVEGELSNEVISGSYNSSDNTYTFTATHFSTYAVTLEDTGTDTTDPENVELTVGERKEILISGYNYENDITTTVPDKSIASMTVVGTEGQEGGSKYTEASVTCKTLISSNKDNWTAASGYYYTPDGTNYYPVYAKRSRSLDWSSLSYTYTYTWGYSTTSSTSNVKQIGTQSTTDTSTTPNITVYTQSTADDVPASTTITFTGVYPGTTTAKVGGTTYNITVLKDAKTVNLSVDGTATYTDASTGTPVVADSTVASATLSNGTLTITGLKDGTTTVTTDTTVYTVTVSAGTPITIKENETQTISVELSDGQYVKWSSADSNYAGVAGKYDTTAGTYTNEAILAGQNVTDSPVVVTATIYNADGTVAGTQKWLVTVTAGDTDSNTSSKSIYFNIDTIENCTVYYSINGGELIPVNGTGVTTGDWTGNGTYTGHFNIMFFAKPDDGYALTYMSISGSADQYYTLSNGNPDGTGSDAWPFKDSAASTIPSSSSDSEWKTVNGSLHGFRWALLEGNMTIDQMKVMFSNAIALGCDGATTITKNGSDGMGSASSPTVCKFVAQKLPTVDKSIESIKRGEDTIPYIDGMTVKIGDTINYTITVTKYATNVTYGTITYDNVKLTDALTNNTGISNPNLGTSTTSDEPYTYNTSLTLTKENFGTVVKKGTITNEVEFSCDYSAQYTAGSLNKKASATVVVTVEIPSFVIDFGLPVEIDLSGSTSGAGRITKCTNGTYGTAKVNTNGDGFIYTPNKILQGVDYVEFTYQLDSDETTEYTHSVAIYPATTVYYEEDFLTIDENNSDKWEIKGSTKNNYQSPVVLGSAGENNYGYDSPYADDGAVSSNGTYIESSTGGLASFTFTGTGFQLYANSNTSSGYVTVYSNGNLSKLYMINTVLSGGTTGATNQQTGGTYYSLPIISETALPYGTYTVQIKQTNGNAPIYIDGVRIINTLENSSVFNADKEDNPDFYELRDYVLNVIGVEDLTQSEYIDSNDRAGLVDAVNKMAGQVYTALGDGAKAVVINTAGTSFTNEQAQDLLDNGPKNELYLYPGQTLAFSVTTDRVMQLGLKSPTGSAQFTLTVDGAGVEKSLTTTVDMFYKIAENGGTDHTVTINVTGGVLSVTLLKICDDPNFTFNSLTEDDITNALMNLYGIGNDTASGEGITEADATLDVTVRNMFGRKLGTVKLTANGTVGEAHVFTSDEILEAVKTELGKNYIPTGKSGLSDTEVKYGETVKVVLKENVDITTNRYFSIDFGKLLGNLLQKVSKNYNAPASADEVGVISNEVNRVVKANGNVTRPVTPVNGNTASYVVVEGNDIAQFPNINSRIFETIISGLFSSAKVTCTAVEKVVDLIATAN